MVALRFRQRRPSGRCSSRLLGASGFGPKLALALLSALGPERTVRSILARDLAALSSVSGIGRKKAERLVLELQDRFSDVVVERPGPRARDQRRRCGRSWVWAMAWRRRMTRCVPRWRRRPGRDPAAHPARPAAAGRLPWRT